MRWFAAVAIAGLLQLASPLRAQTAETSAEAAEDGGDAPESILEMGVTDSDRMTLPVHIGGQGPYAFIVDTAATRSVVSREIALALALKPAGRLKMLSLTGTSEVAQVHVPGLVYRPGRSDDIRAFALSKENVGGDGIIGIDTLKNQRLVIDFAARTIAVTQAPRRKLRDNKDPNTIVVEARRRLGQLILADSTIDGEKIDVVVDTGAQVSLGNLALRSRLMRRSSGYTVQPITLLGVTGGTLTAEYTRVDRLRIGRAEIIGLPVAFADAYPFRKLKLRKPALLLGMDALRMFTRVTVDFANKQASFVLPEEAQLAAKPGS